MGRFMGRRPDRTPQIAEQVRPHLRAGEEVLAGVHVQRPGTTGAALEGATSGAVAGAVGASAVTFRDGDGEGDDGERQRWSAQLDALDAGPAAVRHRRFVLVLTDQRVVVHRARRGTGRPGEPVLAWPLAQVDTIEVPRNGDRLTLTVGGAPLTFELPLAHRFLPDVYRQLPSRFADARRRAG